MQAIAQLLQEALGSVLNSVWGTSALVFIATLAFLWIRSWWTYQPPVVLTYQPVMCGDITLESLSKFDGRDFMKPLYFAVRGKVYDVTKGKDFYGPGTLLCISCQPLHISLFPLCPCLNARMGYYTHLIDMQELDITFLLARRSAGLWQKCRWLQKTAMTSLTTCQSTSWTYCKIGNPSFKKSMKLWARCALLPKKCCDASLLRDATLEFSYVWCCWQAKQCQSCSVLAVISWQSVDS